MMQRATLWLSVAVLLVTVLLTGCVADRAAEALAEGSAGGSPGRGDAGAQPGTFDDYWYQGQAEITSYRLEQARYGEVHEGQAVLVFVTEDFSRERHVKLDRPESAGADRVPILKLNATRKFYTGVYPYSMMTSVFGPVGGPSTDSRALKVTTSSQEWCGHSFTQLNRSSGGYRLQQNSYFEAEGDLQVALDIGSAGVWLEDDLWLQLRTRPNELPLGELELIPSTVFQRLRHLPWRTYGATVSRFEDEADPSLLVYQIEYKELDRFVSIRFTRDFPHAIESWDERYRSGWGDGSGELTTRATRLARVRTDYWNRHRLEDAALRDELRLTGP